jgi:hypothetical protein
MEIETGDRRVRRIGYDFFPIKKANQWFKLISPRKRRRTDEDLFSVRLS